jgi:hypothetical protein
MKTMKRRAVVPLPVLAAELMLCSWETIARRTWMMATGSCSVAEYQRMVLEKANATGRSAQAMLSTPGMGTAAAMLAPWHRCAAANVKRLRRARR